ncbi:MAG: cofactor-independent phosphoglycerate mutase [Marinilabiliaceae bacterium]|nr:cofactor-independent phosphoglycerate mutase [Marinilabiliaceae bacterium]
MKYLVILADGFADRPIEHLGYKTPMMVAHTPHIDQLCQQACCGTLKTVPDSLHPGSEVANMTIMGYDAEKYYQGRGVLEAAALGVDIQANDLVFRCNLVTEHQGQLVNHSGGHVSTEEAHQLIHLLNEKLGNDRVQFYPGVSYRNVLVIKNGVNGVSCTPPHDVPGASVKDVLPTATEKSEDTAKLLQELMLASRDLLTEHPVNIKRQKEGKPLANMIWPWSPGHKPQMPLLKELYGIDKGAVISAVDLIHGLGKLAGLESIFVEGATGLFDTNYSGKAEAALKAMESNDYVFLHIEAPDEAGHEGDVELKIKTLEDIDRLVVAPILKYLSEHNESITVALLPDHPTPCEIRTHTRDHVPFLIRRPGVPGDTVQEYNEESVMEGSIGFLNQTEFMLTLLQE